MKTFLLYLLTAVVAYLLGSISFSIIISKLFHKTDIRAHGSHNAGGTNAFRVFGPVSGIVVIIGDILKGVLAVYLGKYIFFGQENMLGALIAGAFAIMGHVFPIFFRFKGGKGVATAAGLLLIIDYRIFIAAVLVFTVMLLIFRYVSLASISAAVSYPFITFFYNRAEEDVLLMTLMALFTGAFVVFTHRANIARLISGSESKIGRKKE